MEPTIAAELYDVTAGHTATCQARRDYWIAWGATLLFFSGFYALLVPLPRYLSAAGLTDVQVGLVLGAFGVASLLGRPMAGMAADRWGQRRVMGWGSVALLLGVGGMPFTSSVAALFCLRLVQALGYVAFTTAGTALVIARTPAIVRRQRLALFGVAANVAMTISPALMTALLSHVPLTAAFGLAGGLALLAGLATRAITPQPAPPDAAPSWRWAVPAPLRLPMLVTLCFGLGFGAFFQFIPLLAERRGVVSAGLLYTCYGAGIIATRVLSQRWLGRVGTGPLLVTALLVLSLGLGWTAWASTAGALAAASLLIAAGNGLLHPALIAHHARLLPGVPGRATAAFYLAFDLGIGAGSWLLGGVLEYAGFVALYATAALVVLGALGCVPVLVRALQDAQPH